MDYLNTETTHRSMMESLSSDQITRMKEELKNSFTGLSEGLTRLYISLRISGQPISDGVLTRILTDVGYVSVYKSAGYFSINFSWKLENLQAELKRREKEIENEKDEEYSPDTFLDRSE